MRPLDRRRNDLLHLGNRDHGKLLDEQQEPHREPAEAAEQDRPVHPCRRVVGPLPRFELVRERRNDDDEPLEPHADVDEYRQYEQPGGIPPPRLPEQRERQHHVADDHDPGGPPPLPEDAIHEVALLELVAAVPRNPELGEIGEAHHH